MNQRKRTPIPLINWVPARIATVLLCTGGWVLRAQDEFPPASGVPEPSTFILVAAGVAVFGYKVYKDRTKNRSGHK